ncbi:uncharacterized protein LOC118761868 [Octopus sinensis]|uniref:Uncharacterized protein LOC118761868 n=1 Tax=Octopus sinensis TaxID=2607531 RepID=A0A7E6ELT6_9MOLL|nr:uncharacterized protein LOC118761868 [Octopus sinensis]
MKWQWELPFPVHPHIAVFQGTLYVPDTQLNRVLLYKYQDRSSGCRLPTKSPYIRNLNLRLKEKENDQKLVIGEICNLANGQLVVSDINHDCLLYISEEGDIVSRLSLPSTATHICRWDSNHIGVILPLQKQLRVIGNISKTVRSVSLRQPYVRVCKMGECEIVCYCDKPSHLDILAINYYNQVEVIKTINIPVFVKSLSIDKKTEKLLIVTRGKAFQYNTRIGGGSHGSARRQSGGSGSISSSDGMVSSDSESETEAFFKDISGGGHGGLTDEDVIIVFNRRFIIFFNSGGQYLHSVRHYMKNYFADVYDRMTIDDSFLYIHGQWEKCLGSTEYGNILCLTQNGEYKRIFLNERIYKDKVDFSSIDCKGPRHASVCPIPNKGSSFNPIKYHAMALTSNISQIMKTMTFSNTLNPSLSPVTISTSCVEPDPLGTDGFLSFTSRMTFLRYSVKATLLPQDNKKTFVPVWDVNLLQKKKRKSHGLDQNINDMKLNGVGGSAEAMGSAPPSRLSK